MSFLRILSIACLVVFTSCGTQRLSQTDEPVLIYQKTACFGQCPTYTMSFYANGTVKLEGRAHIDKLGTYEKNLGKKRVKYLLKTLDEIDFCSLDDAYGMGVSDFPSTIISYECDGQKKRVEAIMEMPEGLAKFIDETHTIIDENGWELLKNNVNSN